MLLLSKKGGMVTFICELKSEADEVFLAGDFNQWDAQSMRMSRAKDSSFRISRRLPPGQYRYKFIIDGVWHNDPDAPREERDQSGDLISGFVVVRTVGCEMH